MQQAQIHFGATLNPSKLDALRAWLPAQEWFTHDPAEIEQEATYRFVDPAGEVGIETFLLRCGDDLFQVPLTYRGSAMPDGDEHLVCVMEHNALGTRYVYDGVADDVYLTELERVIRQQESAAELVSTADGSVRPPGMVVRGSGVADDAALIGEIEVVGLITDAPYDKAAGRLTGVLPDSREVVLAVLR